MSGVYLLFMCFVVLLNIRSSNSSNTTRSSSAVVILITVGVTEVVAAVILLVFLDLEKSFALTFSSVFQRRT